ncbi:superoxide dismutase family protein [Chengkuizengella sp. YPA3-1-1]|uniref:Superoxide dismutase [Cu-Zn] n=2 Tax=Chengkuizengella marina TaxID=2507566 RepID=A0A6N9Q0K7_9BACL|nr:superoxide dismutase family protein [Chengkuizengella marina]
MIFLLVYIYENKNLTVNSLNETEAITIEILNKEGENVGKGFLKEDRSGVKLQLNVHSLTAGEHGFHVHEVGECKNPDFITAGGHFNPMDKQHGFQNPSGHHSGDLENIIVNLDGNVNTEVVLSNVTLKEGEEHSLLDHDGSSIVIHQLKDDYLTDPSGNSGPRIACGEINK